MAGLFGAASTAAPSSTTGDISKDVEIPQSDLPTDSISDLQFSPTNDFLAVASWDKKVYIYEISASGARGKWLFECSGPVFGVAWSTVSASSLTVAVVPGRRINNGWRLCSHRQLFDPEAMSSFSRSDS
jgi:WD40 repeat protein